MSRYSLGTPWSADASARCELTEAERTELAGMIAGALYDPIDPEVARAAVAKALKTDGLRSLDRFLPARKAAAPTREYAAVAPNATLIVEHLVTGLRTAGAPSQPLLAHERVPVAA